VTGRLKVGDNCATRSETEKISGRPVLLSIAGRKKDFFKMEVPIFHTAGNHDEWKK